MPITSLSTRHFNTGVNLTTASAVIAAATGSVPASSASGVSGSSGALWMNQSSGTAARNGTTSHTITFATDGDHPFVPTTGSLLVVIVAGAVTTTWPGGWTERLSPVNNTELSVATIAASSTTSVTVTHNGSNYPVNWVAYEFPAGSTWLAGVQAQAQATSDPQPTVTGLSGASTVSVFYAVSQSVGVAGGATESATWAITEDVDRFTEAAETDGVWLGVAHQAGVTASSAATTPTLVNFRDTQSERVTFALDLVAVPAAPSTRTALVAGATGSVPAATAGSTSTATALPTRASATGSVPAATASGSSIGTTLASDTFTRANQSGLGTATTGGSWTHPGTNNWAIASNQATTNSGTGVPEWQPAWLSTGQSDVEVAVDFTFNNMDAGPIARVTDTDNLLFLDISYNGSGQIAGNLFRRVAGTFTAIGTLFSISSLTDGTVHTAKLRCVGSAITAYIDGVLVCSGTDTTQTGTGAGLARLGGVNPTVFDNLTITSSVAAPLAAFTLGTQVGVPTGTSLTSTSGSLPTQDSTTTFTRIDPITGTAVSLSGVKKWSNRQFTATVNGTVPTGEVWWFDKCLFSPNSNSFFCFDVDTPNGANSRLSPTLIFTQCTFGPGAGVTSDKALTSNRAWMEQCDVNREISGQGRCEDGWISAVYCTIIESNIRCGIAANTTDPHSDGLQITDTGGTAFYRTWLDGGPMTGALTGNAALRVATEFGGTSGIDLYYCGIGGKSGNNVQFRGDNGTNPSPLTNVRFRGNRWCSDGAAFLYDFQQESGGGTMITEWSDNKIGINCTIGGVAHTAGEVLSSPGV